MELAALRVLLGDVVGSILEHLEALVAQGTFHPVSLNLRAGTEPRSCLWLCPLTCLSEVNPAPPSRVLHCSHATEPGQGCPLSPGAVIPSSRREKEQVWELGAISQLLEWVSVTLVVTMPGLQVLLLPPSEMVTL